MKKILLAFFIVLFPTIATADVGLIKQAKVTGTVVDTDSFGICGAYITPGPETELAACKSGLITFDCNAELAGSSRSTNMMKFDQSVAALALGRAVRVFFTDDKTINGYCFAEQITLRTNSAP